MQSVDNQNRIGQRPLSLLWYAKYLVVCPAGVEPALPRCNHF